jgi:hypothetical protein
MIAATLSGAYEQHMVGIVESLGGPPTHVFPVPSTRVDPSEQPLLRVTQAVTSLAHLAAPAPLTPRTARVPRSVQRDLFEVSEAVSGRRILLVEDLWVGGTTSESTAAPLIADGAKVAVLAIGRDVNPSFMTGAELLKSLGKPLWWWPSRR